MKNLELLQEQIDATKYWDMPILDVQTQYFGDELYIYIEIDDETCWKITFLMCASVKYETDAGWRPDGKPQEWWRDDIKNLRGGQLGYFGQDITISQNSKEPELIDSSLDLSLMFMNITCRDIVVEKVNMSKLDFFWQHDVKK